MPYDDVYYSSQTQVADNQINNDGYSEVDVYEGEYEPEYADQEQEEYEYPDYFHDFDAYYNYLFSARLRRFHRPYYSYGYYNNYFTNMYWYELNPYMWGTSIYLNSSWMMPYEYGGWSGNFYAGLSMGFGGYGMGWPYYNYGWPYGFNYHNYYGIGFNHYASYHGYGYYRDYYYNSHDRYSQYYRHRPNRGRNYNRPNGELSTFGEMYEKRYYASRENRNSDNNPTRGNRDSKSFTNKSLSVGTPSNGRNRSNTTIANGASGGAFTGTPSNRLNNSSSNSSLQRNVGNQNAKSFSKPQDSRKTSQLNSSRRNLQNTKTVKTYKKPILKYSKPNAAKSTNNRNSNLRQYGTQQKFTNPSSRTSTPSSSRTRINNTTKSLKRVITSPSRSSKSYTSPSRSNGKPVSVSRSSSKKSFSTPIRSSSRKSFSTPSRSSSRSVSSSSRSSSSVSRSSSSTTKSSSGSSSRGKRK